MDDLALAQWIERKINTSLNESGGELSAARQKSLNYYLGEKFGNEREGHSQVVSREVFEAIEWAMPSILKVFTSRAVEFLPEGPEDEEAADQETDVVRHLLFERENGFLALYAWAKDCLMYPNGYVKIWADEEEKTTKERYRALTIEQVISLTDQEGVELVAGTAYPTAMGELYDIEAKVTKTTPVLRFESVPPEECIIDGDLTSIELDDAEFVCHRTHKTLSPTCCNGIRP